ncbi:hypothetical protein [Photorhabdus sp. RM323S]|uniref:hypothetical protein n=1 Tax=Photorhabdus sp. RM323S TaxID=3342828 RepID=UPI0036DF3829
MKVKYGEANYSVTVCISKDGKVAGKLTSYPAKNENPDDDCCAYNYALYLKQIKRDDKIELKIEVSGKGNTSVEIPLSEDWNKVKEFLKKNK